MQLIPEMRQKSPSSSSTPLALEVQVPAQGAQALDVGQGDVLDGRRAVALLDAQLVAQAVLRRVALRSIVLPQGLSLLLVYMLISQQEVCVEPSLVEKRCPTAAAAVGRFNACSSWAVSAAFLLRPFSS